LRGRFQTACLNVARAIVFCRPRVAGKSGRQKTIVRCTLRYFARDPFQLPPLCEPGQDRVRNTQSARLGGGHQAVILLGQGEQLV